MSQLFIVTTPQNSGLGTPLATAFNYTNSNFSELYSRYQVTPPGSLVGQEGDVAGMYASDSTYFYYCFADYDGSSVIWAQVTQVANISLTSINSGTSNVAIGGASANVTVGINGTSNVAVFATTGLYTKGIISATGNVRGSYILGNGSQLTGLPATYTDSNVVTLMGAFGSNPISTTGSVSAGDITGSDITGDNILASNLSLSGNVLSSLIVDDYIYSNGNVTTGSNFIAQTGYVYAGGNVTGGNLLTSGRVSAGGNVTGSNINSSGVISATGNITTTGYFLGSFIGNMVSTISNVPGPSGAVLYNDGTGNVAATAGLVFDNSGPNVLTVLGSFSATSNITSANLNATNISGTLTTNSQPNITTVGSLDNLTVSANITGGNISTGGSLSVTGNATFSNISATNYTGTTVSVTGNVAGGNIRTGGSLSVTGNITGASLIGNIATAAQNNITSVGTLSSLSVTANIQTGNLRVSGAISATGTIVAGNVDVGGNVSATNHTGTSVSVTSSVIGGNFRTGGTVSAAGNVTGNYLLGNVSLATGFPATYNDSNVALFLSAFGSNSISTTGTVTSSSTVGGIITGNSLSVSGNVTGNSLIGTIATASQTAITSVGTLDNLSVAGNIVSGNIDATNHTGNAVSVTGNVTGNYILGNGSALTGVVATNVGTLDSLSVTGNIVSGNLTVGAGTITVGNIVSGAGNLVGNIGTTTTWFGNAYIQAVNALYADLAENYIADTEYPPGTVVIFGGSKEITVTTESADERVAGVISTNPAYLMNSGEAGIPVALRGKVPVRVVGPVAKGDSLVTSTTPGAAHSVGRSREYAQAVFAKSLETSASSDERVILAVIV